MKKRSWLKNIREATQEAGTYRPYFEMMIDTLAEMLEHRDAAQLAFEKSGSAVLVKHTNKAGQTNIEQNPALRLINDLNRDALTYWRELGLTPTGLKRLNEKAMNTEEEKPTGLVAALIAIGNDNDINEDVVDAEAVLKTLE